jgi:hypothetical protein
MACSAPTVGAGLLLALFVELGIQVEGREPALANSQVNRINTHTQVRSGFFGEEINTGYYERIYLGSPSVSKVQVEDGI